MLVPPVAFTGIFWIGCGKAETETATKSEITVAFTGIFWIGCGKAETETATKSEITSEADSTIEPSFRTRGEGFMSRIEILSMLAFIDDETVNISLNEAIAENRITVKQKGDINLWWVLRPEFLNPDSFPRQIFAFNRTQSE